MQDNSNTCYSYCSNTLQYLGISQMQSDPLEGGYLLPSNATLIAPISYDISNQYLTFDLDNQTWNVNEIQLEGQYYLMTNGSLHTSINQKDLALYVISPIPPILNEGDIIFFDTGTSTWVYNMVSAITQTSQTAAAAALKIQSLNTLYMRAENSCYLIYNTYTVQFSADKLSRKILKASANGNTWSYDIYVSNVRISNIPSASANLIQTGLTLYHQNLRYYKQYYTTLINAATTVDEVSAIAFSPLNIAGITVDINTGNYSADLSTEIGIQVITNVVS